MKRLLSVYIGSALLFLLIDALWLGLIAAEFYREHMGDLMRAQPDFVVAGLFYLGFVVGLLFFATYRARHITGAIGLGALFGLFTYATYELTALAVIRDWPPLVAVVDIAWGSTICAVVAGAGYWISMKVS